MKKINLGNPKINLSELIEFALKGEEIIICKAGQPVAKLIAFQPKKEKRKPALMKNMIIIKKDFDVLPEEFMKNFKL